MQKVKVERVMTDNGSAFRARRWAKTCEAQNIRHKRTRPYTPRTNGKAERFIQTLLREWAYRFSHDTSDERKPWLTPYLHFYNYHRAHSAVAYNAPISRLDRNNVLRRNIAQRKDILRLTNLIVQAWRFLATAMSAAACDSTTSTRKPAFARVTACLVQLSRSGNRRASFADTRRTSSPKSRSSQRISQNRDVVKNELRGITLPATLSSQQLLFLGRDPSRVA
jgi:hypothetical protein